MRVEIGSELACPTCEIELAHLVRLGAAEGPGAFASRPYAIARDTRGRYYVVTPESFNEPPYMLDSAGHFLLVSL
ncbi:MAG TPA: hypothetical protein VGA37_14160 [Gemmatimonadales bacterium]